MKKVELFYKGQIIQSSQMKASLTQNLASAMGVLELNRKTLSIHFHMELNEILILPSSAESLDSG